MRVHLIRHSLTPETGKRLSSLDPDISLSPQGVEIANELAGFLSGVELTAIYTSPHQRCRETAAAIAKGRGIRLRTDKAFVEADYGKWLGRPLKSLYRLKAWQQLHASASRFRFPEGETLQEVQTRAVAGVEALSAKHANEPIAVSSHGDVIKVIVAYYLGVPLDLSNRLEPMPASVSVVDIPPVGPARVPVFNAVPDARRWR
ncbi:MAG: histidine phosphatase family protein [Acidimicrobiia bacterium]|nr:histidine phosphatase family protein [Acidimicrobiia bacterium]